MCIRDRSYPDELSRIVLSHIKTISDQEMIQIKHARIKSEKDVMIAIEGFLGISAAYNMYKNELIPAFNQHELLCYHATRLDCIESITRTGKMCIRDRVKGWHEQTVIDVQPTGTIVIQGKDHQLKNENPRKQALSYCYVLQNKIASMTGKHPLVFHMVCYPYLSRSFIEHRGFYANDELKLTLSKEDLESAPMLKTKLQTASGLFGARTVDTLDHSLLYHIRRIFEPEYIEEPRNESGEDGMSKSEAVYPYSIVAVMVKSDYNYTSQIDRLVESYAHGTKVFAIFSSENAAAYAPVSSTHLDVYKRQPP